MDYSTYDICKYAVEHNNPSIWINCINVLMRTLKTNPNIKIITDADINLDENFSIKDLKQIWKWMLDDYQYQGKNYRSQMLETDYYHNYSLQDTPKKFAQNIPTNFSRSVKYYTVEY